MTEGNPHDEIRMLAEMYRDTIRGATGIGPEYDEPSVMMLDEIIAKSFPGGCPEGDALDRMINLFGAYFGEALVASLGMHWMERPEDGQWVVAATTPTGDDVTTNPFNKIHKRFVNGEEDSISYFYQMLKKMLAGELKV